MAVELGETDYRAAALERLHEAGILLREGELAGSVYLAGRAVESILRALIWKHDREIRAGRKTLDTGHNLREMLELVRDLGVMKQADDRSDLVADVQHVGRLWFNNMRFFSNAKLKSYWFRMGEIGGKRTMKRAVPAYYDSCSAIVKRCEALWHG